jgi:hypothetical protein
MALANPLLPFDISRQFQQNKEEIIAQFKNEKDAQEFMEAKVNWDHKTKVQTIYRLYENNQIKKKVDALKQESLDSSGGEQGAGRRTGPSPFSTSPKPPGSGPARKPEDDIDDE